MMPENFEKIHIEKAIAEIDQNGIQNGAQSSTYDLIYNGNRYPPKLVISLANKYANGEELPRDTFKGGVDTDAFKIMQGLGFIIEKKENIRNLIEEFLSQSKTDNLKTKHYKKVYKSLVLPENKYVVFSANKDV